MDARSASLALLVCFLAPWPALAVGFDWPPAAPSELGELDAGASGSTALDGLDAMGEKYLPDAGVQAGSSTPTTTVPVNPYPTAGHASDHFFLRSTDGDFVLIPAGRLQSDFLLLQPSPAVPSDTFLVAGARLEVLGTLMKHWDFRFGGDFATSASPTLADAYLNADYTHYANVELGQFDGPFTMENRTHDEWTDLQARARGVAALGIPENKEMGAMVWGQPEGQWAYWSVGVFNGEGTENVSRVGSDFDLMGRAWLAPFGMADADVLRWAWFGISEWRGERYGSLASPIDRPAMTDPAGFAFWSPVYGAIHVGDDGPINKWAAEINVPVGSMVLKAEAISSAETTRELDETTPGRPVPIRAGTLDGFAYYLRASVFAWGDPLINGLGGMQDPPHLARSLRPDRTGDALQFVVNVEQLSFSYAAASLRFAPNSEPADVLIGNYGATFFTGGINYWYTPHVRLTANFIYDIFSDASLRPQAVGATETELTLRASLVL